MDSIAMNVQLNHIPEETIGIENIPAPIAVAAVIIMAVNGELVLGISLFSWLLRLQSEIKVVWSTV